MKWVSDRNQYLTRRNANENGWESIRLFQAVHTLKPKVLSFHHPGLRQHSLNYIAKILIAWLNSVIHHFQHDFSHIMVKAYIIYVCSWFSQYWNGALKCLARGLSLGKAIGTREAQTRNIKVTCLTNYHSSLTVDVESNQWLA